MSETRYTIELAKSGRSKCQKCKEPIANKTMRIGQHCESSDGYNMSKWCHVHCFKLPKKYSTGAGKMSVEDFVRDVLEDTSDADILSENIEEIVEKIEAASAPAAKKGARKSPGGAKKGAAAAGGPLGAIKAAYEKDRGQAEDGKPRSPKKAKSDMASKLDAYEKYKGSKNDELKNVLRWNNQFMTGAKDFLLAKVIDGVVYGRLSRCELCGGSLKLDADDGNTIVCGGGFDEATQRRIECSFRSTAEEAPRWQPFYEEEPTQEETEAMDQLIEQYKEAEGKPTSNNTEEDTEKLVEAVSELDWDLTNTQGIKSTVKALTEVLLNGDYGEGKLDLPEDVKEAKKKVLGVVNMNRDKSADEMVPLLIEELGWAQAKAAKKAQKQALIESMTGCAANAAIVAALQELSELYFKESNRNAGLTYQKAVAAVRELDFEITEDNAKGLGKGKTKVANIGKGTADKIHEFVTTGTIAKLEEKRADAA